MISTQIILRVVEGGVGMALWGYAIYSLVVGLRYGFKFPRSLHWVTVSLLTVEIAVLAIFPIGVGSVSLLLTMTLICLPVSPYLAWIMSGGPVRCRDERMKQGITERGVRR